MMHGIILPHRINESYQSLAERREIHEKMSNPLLDPIFMTDVVD
jgi:hypothetical protein